MTNEEISAIAPFENELNKMTVEEMREALATTTDPKLREALTACLSIEGLTA